MMLGEEEEEEGEGSGGPVVTRMECGWMHTQLSKYLHWVQIAHEIQNGENEVV